MAKKITISVPDELSKRIKRWREDLDSFSSIFQDAISREIEKIELCRSRQKAEVSLQNIFKNGDFRTPETQFVVGKEMGFAYAKTAPYPEIKRFEEFEEIWDEGDSEELMGFHFQLNMPAILAREIGVEASEMGPKGIPKFAIRLTHSFDLGFMEGVIEFIKGQFTPVEIRKLSPDRDKQLYVVKDMRRQTKIIEDTMAVAEVLGEDPWDEDWDVEDPFADY